MRIADWVVVAAYAAMMLAVGKYYARRNKTAEDYNLGRYPKPSGFDSLDSFPLA